MPKTKMLLTATPAALLVAGATLANLPSVAPAQVPTVSDADAAVSPSDEPTVAPTLPTPGDTAVSPAPEPETVDATTLAVDWAYALSHCPDERGSFAHIWEYNYSEDEQVLLDFDIEGSGTTFDLLADYEGTSIIIRVRDAESGESVGVIKTTSSNTLVEGEIYAYRLADFLGFEELVPDTVPVALAGEALVKMRDLLEDTDYDDENKERQRQRIVRQLSDAINNGTVFYGAMKPWLRAFIFNSEHGHRDRLADADVMDHLRARGRQPDDEDVRLTQFTRLYSPQGTFYGHIPMWQLAEDMSNIMLMDALTGQNDRFAGANLHVIAVDGELEEDGERRGYPIYQMGDVRMLALDNGATLHSNTGSGILDLMGNRESGTRVERFERESIDRLYGLSRRVLGHGCETAPFEDERAAIWAYFGVSGEEIELAEGYLVRTMEYLDEVIEDHGEDAYLSPVLPEPEPVVVAPEGSAEPPVAPDED